MKLLKTMFVLVFALFCSMPMFAQSVETDDDVTEMSSRATPTTIDVWFRDVNGFTHLINNVYPPINQDTQIQIAWQAISDWMGIRSFDIYYNGQKLDVNKKFADYWILNNSSVTVDVKLK